jgi:hypothetical protein
MARGSGVHLQPHAVVMSAADPTSRKAMRAAMLLALVAVAVVCGQAARSAQRSELFDPVAAALADHEDAAPEVSHAMLAAKRIAVAHRALNDPRMQRFADHPWDSGNPEGMPTQGGRLISAYEMVQQAGQEPARPVAGMVLQDPSAEQIPRARVSSPPAQARTVTSSSFTDMGETSAEVMSGGGTEDPLARTDLDQALLTHEGVHQASAARPRSHSGQAFASQGSRQMIAAGGQGACFATPVRSDPPTLTQSANRRFKKKRF